MLHPLSSTQPDQDPGLRLTIALDQIRDSFNEDDDPRRMFIAILDLLITQFHAEGGAIVLLEDSTGDIEGIVTSHLHQGEALDLCRAALTNDRPRQIDNPYWPYALGDQIALRGHALGGMVLVRRNMPFADADTHLLGIAERQIDSAVVQARMIWKLAAQTRELSGIAEVDSLCAEADSRDALLRSFLLYVQRAFAADFAAVYLTGEVLPALQFNIRGMSDESLANIHAQVSAAEESQAVPAPRGLAGLMLLSTPVAWGADRMGHIVVGRESLFTTLDQHWLKSVVRQFASSLSTFMSEPASVSASAAPVQRASDAPLDETTRYQGGELTIDGVRATDIAAQAGTPAYVYSLKRVASNFRTVQAAFPQAHIHFSAKSNNNPAILRLMAGLGAGVDAVSAGEIHLARRAQVPTERIVFAGVGKPIGELYYAVSSGVGWFNIENEDEARLLNVVAAEVGVTVRAALRFNPSVAARTHRFIATGHSAAKFGLSAARIQSILGRADDFPQIAFRGIHIHIGSQLEDTEATQTAVAYARELAMPYPSVRTLNIGGGFPAAYLSGQGIPDAADFSDVILPQTDGFDLILEPGRSLVANAGILLMRVLYIKQQGGRRFVIVDAGMTELIRPMLYQAQHAYIPVTPRDGDLSEVALVGPVCESTDVFADRVLMPPLEPGDLIAALTAGAYGMVMSSNYNARLRPPEVVVSEDGNGWEISRRRETWDDLTSRDE